MCGGKHQLATRGHGSPVKLYHGCSGKRAARLAGKTMDGILISGLYLALLRTGRVGEVLNAATEGRRESSHSSSSSPREFHLGCEINLSISEDGDKALQNPKGFLAHVISGSYDRLRLIEPLEIDRVKVQRMKDRLARGASFEDLAALISDEDVKNASSPAPQGSAESSSSRYSRRQRNWGLTTFPSSSDRITENR